MTIRMEVEHNTYRGIGGFDANTVRDIALMLRASLEGNVAESGDIKTEGSKTIITIPCQPIHNLDLAKLLDETLQERIQAARKFVSNLCT